MTFLLLICNSTFASSHLLQFQGVKGVLTAGKRQGRAKTILMFSQMDFKGKGICLNSLTPFNSLTPKKLSTYET